MLERDGASEAAELRLVARAMRQFLHGAAPPNVQKLVDKANDLYSQAQNKMTELKGRSVPEDHPPEDLGKLEERLQAMKTECGKSEGDNGKAQAEALAKCFQAARDWWATLKAPMQNSYNKNKRVADQDVKNKLILQTFLEYDPMTAVNADLVGMAQRLLQDTKALNAGVNNLIVRGSAGPEATGGAQEGHGE